MTVARNPEQNGKAEKLNQALLSVARCMLLHANISMSFWPEAVRHANYLRNRVKSRVINNKTPFELWHGRNLSKDDLSLIKVFGSEVWVKTDEKTKLGARARRGIYLGVQHGIKGVKVWDLESKKLLWLLM